MSEDKTLEFMAIAMKYFPNGKMRTASRSQIANLIRQTRLFKNLSQDDLGALMSRPGTYIHKIEHGWHSPSVRTLELFARAMDMELRIDFVPKGGADGSR